MNIPGLDRPVSRPPYFVSTLFLLFFYECVLRDSHGEVLLMPVGVPAEGVDDAIV